MVIPARPLLTTEEFHEKMWELQGAVARIIGGTARGAFQRAIDLKRKNQLTKEQQKQLKTVINHADSRLFTALRD